MHLACKVRTADATRNQFDTVQRLLLVTNAVGVH
jgi:hypothetical protein